MTAKEFTPVIAGLEMPITKKKKNGRPRKQPVTTRVMTPLELELRKAQRAADEYNAKYTNYGPVW